MAENFWDVLEGRTSESRGATSSAVETAPAFVPAPAAPERRVERAAPAAPERRVERAAPAERRAPESEQPVFNFTPDPTRTAENAATAAMVVKEQMPEPAAASPTKDFMDNILGLWQIPAAVAGYEVVRRTYKAMKDSGTPSTRSLGDIDVPFNRPVETTATSAPPARTTTPAQTVMTAGGPVNLSDVPPEMRPMVERSAQVTQQRMAGGFAGPVTIDPNAAPATSSMSQTVEQGGNITKSVQAEVAQKIDATPLTSPEANKTVTKTIVDNIASKIGPGDQWLHNNLGPNYKLFIDTYNKGNPVGSYQNAINIWGKTFQGPKIADIPLSIRMERGIAPPPVGGSFGKIAIEPPSSTTAAPIDAAKNQSGKASIGTLANTALNAAGGLMLVDMFKKARETGDYSDFALGAIGQILGNIASPKTNVGYMLMQPNTVSSGTLDSPEAQEMMRRREAGAGRGFVNPPQFR